MTGNHSNSSEFNSISISVDHLVLERSVEDPTVVKVVFSEETAQQSLVSQIDYFGDRVDFRDTDVIEMIDTGETGGMLYVYRPDSREGELTNLILDMDAFTAIQNNRSLSDGTIKGTISAAIESGLLAFRNRQEKKFVAHELGAAIAAFKIGVA